MVVVVQTHHTAPRRGRSFRIDPRCQRELAVTAP